MFNVELPTMIPTSNDQSVPSPGGGVLLFHIIVDDHKRIFSIDGSDGPNGVRLHYEMLLVCRAQSCKKLRDFDLRCNSREEAIAQMQNYFSDYTAVGTWASLRSK
jgi:hypothetical protein